MRAHRVSRLSLVASLPLALSAVVHADDWRVVALGGRSLAILGSNDPRTTWALGLEREMGSHPRLRFRETPGKWVVTGYVAYSRGGILGVRDRYEALGLLAASRYWLDRRQRVYAEVGLGLHLASRATYDLTSTVNTTPMLGLGVKSGDALIGLRLLHISNGLWGPRNGGQNQLSLFLATKV